MYDLFGRRNNSFSTIEEIDEFIEEKIGRKLEVINLYEGLVSSREILPIEDMNANAIFDKAVKRKFF